MRPLSHQAVVPRTEFYDWDEPACTGQKQTATLSSDQTPEGLFYLNLPEGQFRLVGLSSPSTLIERQLPNNAQRR